MEDFTAFDKALPSFQKKKKKKRTDKALPLHNRLKEFPNRIHMRVGSIVGKRSKEREVRYCIFVLFINLPLSLLYLRIGTLFTSGKHSYA